MDTPVDGHNNRTSRHEEEGNLWGDPDIVTTG
jgi:hypothetical protein